MIVEWIPPGLNRKPVQFTDDPDGPYFLYMIEGTLSTRASVDSIRTPGQRGATLLDVAADARTIAISGWIAGQSVEDLWLRREELAEALRIEAVTNDELPEPGLLRVYRPKMPVREIEAVPVDSPQDQIIGPTTVDFDIEWYAPDPRWRAVSDDSLIFTRATGFTLPATLPLEATAGSGVGSAFNDGTTNAPVTIRIDGQVTGPITIANLTTGKTLTINHSIENAEGGVATQYIVIRTHYGKKTARLNTPDLDGSVTTINLLPYIDLSASDFWSLIPGDNEIELSASVFTTDATVTITWRPRWIGI